MYTQFYGLREKPFSLSPDPRYLFLSDSHREALAHLLYGIEQGEGFIAITGEVGTGKTTLCRTLLQRVEPGTEIAFIFNPQLSGLELLQAINAELGLATEELGRRELTEQLNRFLLARKAEGRRVLLILDEAQNLEPDALEQVRLLSNLETDTSKLIQIILIGQPELDVMLESPRLRQLRQRISVRWRLRPLSLVDTREYVRHRLKVAAGAPRELFSELALREVHRRSGGIPRLINLLCDRALLAGYAAGAHTVGLALVAQTEREVESGARGLAPSRWPEWLRSPGRRTLAWGAAIALLLLLGAGLGLGARRLLGDAEPASVSAPPPTAAPAAADPEGGALRTASAGGVRTLEAGPAPSAVPIAPTPAAGGEGAASAGEGVAAAPAPGTSVLVEDLGTALARRSPAATSAEALDGLLTAWGQAPVGAELLSLDQVMAALSAEGLRAEPIEVPTLEDALAWDLPLLLELRALDGLPRTLAVVGVDPSTAQVHGLGDGARRVARADLAAHLGGRGWVVWRDLGELPGVLRPGVESEAVDWLQGALDLLGLWSGPATGSYDAATIAGVRAFQAREGLTVDGTVGARTRLRLYARLPTYHLPRLGTAEALAEASR